MSLLNVKLKILDNRLQESLPTYATPGSAAVDLHACIHSPQSLAVGETQLIPSGISIHLADKRYAALILPRSGLGHKQGIVLGNLTGLIDSDYQGEIKVSLWNRGQQDYMVQPFERIAQMIVVPIMQVQWQVVDQFIESNRGEGGFGSTGQ